ncbi:hypothetical protein KC906_01170, partial [Candidatus Kaiserbacteria bacterium]|nr:hypothetical protein [Candidatus Kaiserbacteria bacterium]
AQIKAKLADAKKDLAKTENELDEYKTTVIALHDEVAKLEKQETALNDSITELKKSEKTAQKALDEVTDKVHSSEKILKDLSDNLKATQELVKEAEGTRVELNREIGELEEKRDKAKAEMEVSVKEALNTANQKKHLAQQEAYLQQKFEEAGIPYTPFNPS